MTLLKDAATEKQVPDFSIDFILSSIVQNVHKLLQTM